MAADATAALAIGLVEVPAIIAVAAVVDGIAFGLFLASSQSLVADESGERTKGAAMGTYGMAGAVGETIGALGLGLVAFVLGARVVFIVAGLLLFACVPVVCNFLRAVSLKASP